MVQSGGAYAVVMVERGVVCCGLCGAEQEWCEVLLLAVVYLSVGCGSVVWYGVV